MSEDPDADASNGFGSMAPVLVREAALSFGDESSRAYHVGTVSHVVEEQRCACYTAEHVYQVGRALEFHSFVKSKGYACFTCRTVSCPRFAKN